ncbi:MAG: SGNH/GDSL hydrolase family protein [Clostridia bacterium]|nr:SGNH/GDSL hydrolase family protein [Clostridia bacterium]
MNWEEKLYDKNEKPLDTLVSGYSHTSVFRKIAFVGDSLSSGEFESRDSEGNKGYHDFYEYSWGQYIARKNGLTAYSFSRGGMTAKEYIESFAEEKGFWDKDKACQAYVIALGVNDVYNAGMKIGSVDDIKADWHDNAKTFIGYYAAIVARYKEISPDAKFFFVTFPNDTARNKGDLTHEVIAQLYSLADYFENAYVIDLYKYGPVYDERLREKFYLYGHMNPSGYIFTAELIDSYIDFIVRHNPKDFDRVGFINQSCD